MAEKYIERTAHLNPNFYKWQKVGERLVCREPDTGRMVFNCPIPTTMRQALLFGFFIGWDLADSSNKQHIDWLEGIIDQFRPETLPYSDEDYYELLSKLDGIPLHDRGMQDVLDDMDEEARKEWEAEQNKQEALLKESWEKFSE